MTKPSHTPGPWFIAEGGNGQPFVFAGHHEDLQHGSICAVDGEYDPENNAANAALIAAAPDLLAALEDAEFLLRKAGQLRGPMQDSFNRSASDARATIAKAKGK